MTRIRPPGPARAMTCRAPAALALFALLTLVACRDDDEPITASTTTTEPTSTTSGPATTSTTLDPQADVVARYRMFWQVRFEANREPVNPDDPRFAEYATGQQLANVVKETRERRDNGLAIRRPEPSITERRVKVTQIDGDTATLQDCSTNDGIVYRVAGGEVVDNAVVTYSVLATMRRVDGTWKLDHTNIIQKWEGVAGCALSPEFSS
jgi:hypothetical protein